MKMIHEAEIQALLVKCEPLRKIDEDDPKRGELNEIIAEINAMRSVQDEHARLGKAEPVPAPVVPEFVAPKPATITLGRK